MEGVEATALMAAAARARESERADRLFDDPWAAALAGEEGFELLARYESSRPDRPMVVVAIRNRFFDDFLLGNALDGVRQFVLIAAGLDTRAFRLAWPPKVRVFELDQPGVLAYKQVILDDARASAVCERRTVVADIRDDWAPALLDAGYDPAVRAVWLAEGLLFYLPEPSVHELLETTAKLSCRDSTLGTDTLYSAMPAPYSSQECSQCRAEAEAQLAFGTDRPADLLAKHGWTPTLHWYRDIAEDLGRRWPSTDDLVLRGTIITATPAGRSRAAEIERMRPGLVDSAIPVGNRRPSAFSATRGSKHRTGTTRLSTTWRR